MLIDAVRISSDRSVNVHLTIIGKDRKDLLKDYSDLSDCVSFTGQLEFSPTGMPDDLLATILKMSDVYVSASIDEEAEGMSFAVLEAMSCGLPIVATNISGNREIVNRCENGVLVEPKNEVNLADGIVSAVSDSASYQQMSCNSVRHANQLNWSKIARLYPKSFERASRGDVQT